MVCPDNLSSGDPNIFALLSLSGGSHMAYSYSISSENKLIHVKIQGTLQITEVLNGIKEATLDDQFQPDYKILVEVSDIQFRPTAAEMKQIAELIVELKLSFSKKVALMVPGTFINQMAKLAKYYIHQRTKIEIEVFDNMQDAVLWINAVAQEE